MLQLNLAITNNTQPVHSHSTDHTFSVRGLAICIEFFEREGHVVKAVVPQMRLKHSMSTDQALLEALHKQGKIVLTPCKNLPGKNAVSYDDRFIMDLAAEFDAAVVSNDNYRDLLLENEQSEFAWKPNVGIIWHDWHDIFHRIPENHRDARHRVHMVLGHGAVSQGSVRSKRSISG